MKRIGLACLLVAAMGTGARAQSSIDILEQELKEAKQQHSDATTQSMANFFSQVDAGMGNPMSAVQLYQSAGGVLPDPTPVTTQHSSETPSEKEARLAQDATNAKALGTILQLHCGLMHFGALFVTKPDQKDLPDQFKMWLQQAAQAYPLLSLPPTGSNEPNNGGPQHRRKKGEGGGGGGGGGGGHFNPSEMMTKTLKDSVITKYLGFKLWGDKEQGGWTVRNIPKLYRTLVLEPLRAKPTQATLAAWDVVIAMANSDEKDNDRWEQTVYPPLQFDRACDDYAISPNTEKLEGLVNLVKANPTFPQVDDWIGRIRGLMDDYRAAHGPKTAATTTNPAVPKPPADPNVKVTTEQQGDAVIITTHTNTPPVNPAPPQ